MNQEMLGAISDGQARSLPELLERLPQYPEDVLRFAIAALVQQGVLQQETRPEDGTAIYRYVAPERYAQINQDVVSNPGARVKGALRGS